MSKAQSADADFEFRLWIVLSIDESAERITVVSVNKDAAADALADAREREPSLPLHVFALHGDAQKERDRLMAWFGEHGMVAVEAKEAVKEFATSLRKMLKRLG
jgi:hypothetical protein